MWTSVSSQLTLVSMPSDTKTLVTGLELKKFVQGTWQVSHRFSTHLQHTSNGSTHSVISFGKPSLLKSTLLSTQACSSSGSLVWCLFILIHLGKNKVQVYLRFHCNFTSSAHIKVHSSSLFSLNTFSLLMQGLTYNPNQQVSLASWFINPNDVFFILTT